MGDIFGRKIIDSFKGEYEFLSNFYREPVYYDGCFWPTAEHAYQAAKCFYQEDFDLFKDPKMTPGQAKRLGRKVEMWDNWNDIKQSTMEKIVTAKFVPHSDIAWKLHHTEDAILIEGNTWGDTFWGQCNGEGKNWLGQILMFVRERVILRHTIV